MDADSVALDLEWSDVSALTAAIAGQVARGPRPDVIVGVLRGGAVPAVTLAHALGLRTVRGVEVTHTTQDGPHAGKTPSPVAVNASSLGDLAGLDVLIVDDVAGTGDTLEVTARLVAASGAAAIRTAVWVLNEANWPAGELGRPNYVGTCCRGWVRFPWEAR